MTLYQPLERTIAAMQSGRLDGNIPLNPQGPAVQFG
jgi:hypothetical protein